MNLNSYVFLHKYFIIYFFSLVNLLKADNTLVLLNLLYSFHTKKQAHNISILYLVSLVATLSINELPVLVDLFAARFDPALVLS